MTTEEKVKDLWNKWYHGEIPYSEYHKQLMSIIEEEKNIKVCKWCGHRSDVKIPETALACCPESTYIPLDDYLENSIYSEQLKAAR